jgi:hypothetical protein
MAFVFKMFNVSPTGERTPVMDETDPSVQLTFTDELEAKLWARDNTSPEGAKYYRVFELEE